MRTRIYQINHDRDENRVRFCGLETLERCFGSKEIDASIYDEVLDAEIEETDLEEIFIRFNGACHPLYRGALMSVSDVVVNDSGAFFCEKMGFQQIEFDESQTSKPKDLLRVVYVEPNKPPYEAEIEDTLEAKQKAVGGGLIEVAYNQDGTCLICNEEGKLIGMEANRRIGDGSSIVVGPFFLCGLAKGGFRSLTDEETAKHLERFAEPEQITPEEVLRDTGAIFYSM